MSIENAFQTQDALDRSNQKGTSESKAEEKDKIQAEKKEDLKYIDNELKELSIESKDKVKEAPKLTREEKYTLQVEADARSIFIGNITPDVTPEIIEEHFAKCGEIKRITLLHDKHTGIPKGYAYVQFESPEVQEKALELNGTELKGNSIKVYKKRTNIPGYHRYSQYQSPFYYPSQWGYGYSTFPDLKGVNFFPPYPFQPDHRRHIGRFSSFYRGKPSNSYRGGRRGNGSRNFYRYDNRLRENYQRQGVDDQRILETDQKSISHSTGKQFDNAYKLLNNK